MFKSVISSSQTFKSKTNISFHFKITASPFIGFMINRRFGNAVSRNKFKNQARSLYVHLFNQYSYALIVRPPNEKIIYSELRKAFVELETKLKGATC